MSHPARGRGTKRAERTAGVVADLGRVRLRVFGDQQREVPKRVRRHLPVAVPLAAGRKLGRR